MTDLLPVLVVEADTDDDQVIPLYLRQGGLAVATKRVTTVSDLHDCLTAELWKAVIATTHRPGFGPFEVVALVKRVRPNLPVVVVTEATEEAEVVRLMEAGADDCLPRQCLARLAMLVLRGVRQADERVRRAEVESELQECRKRVDLICNTISDCLIYLTRTPEGGWVYTSTNRAFDERLPKIGVTSTSNKLIGRDAREIEAKEFGFDAETVKWLSARREEAASTDRPLHFERELQYPKGAFVGEFTITPVRGAEATVRQLLVTERDLTKLRRTEEYDRRTRELVTQAQKMEALGKLARGIAHDFNNLLTGVLGFAELATASNSLEEARSHAGQVVGIALRARDLVWQILTYSRPKSSRDPVMVTTIVRDMITLLSATLPKSILLQTHLAEPGPKVVIDPSQLQQVILNLCTNAAHAMPDGGELTLAVEEVYLAADFCADHPPAAPGRYAHLRVADTGSGMPPEVVRRVFEPFFTTKPLGRGTGLGLAVVHSIVAEIKGLVTLDSEVGRGTTFDVYFPTAGSGEQPRPATPPPVGSGERVLCVDNDPALIDLLTRVLHELNYIPIGFTDTARALAAFTADPAAFDLVMTDAEVNSSPGESMAEALRRVRGNIPVLLVSGTAKAPPPALADIVILAKPYSREQIAEALKAALARR